MGMDPEVVYFVLFVVLDMEHSSLYRLGKCITNKLQKQPPKRNVYSLMNLPYLFEIFKIV